MCIELEILNMKYLTKLISLASLEIHCSVEQISIFCWKMKMQIEENQIDEDEKDEFWNILFKAAKARKLRHQISPITLDHEFFF